MISVIIPVYNAIHTLERCVQSVLSQTYQEYEIILVNDGSKDESAILCEALSEKDPRILFFNQDNMGVSAARNKGINVSSGEYIVFVDADDTIEVEMLSKMLDCQKKYDSDLVICNFRQTYDNGQNVEYDQLKVKEMEQIDPLVVVSRVISIADDAIYGSCCRTLFRSKLITDNNIRFQEELTIQEDMQFLLKCIEISKNVSFVPDFLYNVSISKESSTGRFMRSRDYGTDIMNRWLATYVEKMKKFIDLSINYHICVANSIVLNISNTCKKGTTYSFVDRIKYVNNYYVDSDACMAIRIACKYRNRIVKRRYIQFLLFRYRLAYVIVIWQSIKNRTVR